MIQRLAGFVWSSHYRPKDWSRTLGESIARQSSARDILPPPPMIIKNRCMIDLIAVLTQTGKIFSIRIYRDAQARQRRIDYRYTLKCIWCHQCKCPATHPEYTIQDQSYIVKETFCNMGRKRFHDFKPVDQNINSIQGWKFR